MKYIYHLKPDPFVGTFLIPLNQMDQSSTLYLDHAKKYEGRENLMLEIIPKLNCKWNDVVQFSALDPQIIACELKKIHPGLKLIRAEYFKIPVNDIISKYQAVVFKRNSKRPKGDFSIQENDVERLTFNSYEEITTVPIRTVNYWLEVKKMGGKYLWFPYVPHILVKGMIETSKFEVCKLTI